jgi:hypothetical protein
MRQTQTCYGCDYFFTAEDLTLLNDHQTGEILLCADCLKVTA